MDLVILFDQLKPKGLFADLARGQNPNRAPSEYPNPTAKIGSKMGGANTPKWYHWHLFARLSRILDMDFIWLSF